MPKTTPYLIGQNVKPYRVTLTGEVLFTDGTNIDMKVNQPTCESYGYIYDPDTASCRSFTRTNALEPAIRNKESKINGQENQTGQNSLTTMINGTSNIIYGYNNDCLINGNNNTIAENINAGVSLGVGCNINTHGEMGVGGGLNAIPYASTEAYADRKMSVVNLSGVTTDSSTTNLTVNGDGSSFINVKNNSIVGFEMYVTRLEIGGSAGTAGNYSYANIKGVVQIDNSYNMAFIVGFTRNIGKIGVNGTKAMADSSTTDVKSITIAVSDRNNVTNIWSATVYIHELISTSITF